MTLDRRLMWVCLTLLVGAALSWALQLHLEGDAVFAEPRASLQDVPPVLVTPSHGDAATSVVWRGRDNPRRPDILKQVSFADEVFTRLYIPEGGNFYIDAYAAYSKTGEDRKHHPEICIREVVGAPEDTAARKVLPLDAVGKKTVQRFRFLTGTGVRTTVYYFHCTLPPQVSESQTALQAFHRRVASRSPSITVQLSTAAEGEALDQIERSFLPAFEAALSEKVLPPGTVIACDRVPVTLVRR